MINLMLGDCLERMKEIPDGSVDMILADPPYGTTSCPWDSVIPLEPMWEQLKRVIKSNGAIVMMASQPFTSVLVASNLKMFKYCWVWNKKQTGNPFLAKKQPLKIHEDIVVFGGNTYLPQMTKGKLRKKGGAKNGRMLFKENATAEPAIINDEYYPTSIIEVNNCSNRAERQHPTQKPVALMEYLIKTYTNEGETVLDFAAGSFTTAIACINTNRKVIMIEKDPHYFKIGSERVERALSERGD